MGNRKKKPTRRNNNRLTKGDMEALALLDRLVTEDRRIEQKYQLPFRSPRRVATSMQQCVYCMQDIALLIFGDNARDATGLEAYARMMEEPMKKTNLPTYVITPPTTPDDPDGPALLLKVYPDRGEPGYTTPDQWQLLIKTLSDEHSCRRTEEK